MSYRVYFTILTVVCSLLLLGGWNQAIARSNSVSSQSQPIHILVADFMPGSGETDKNLCKSWQGFLEASLDEADSENENVLLDVIPRKEEINRILEMISDYEDLSITIHKNENIVAKLKALKLHVDYIVFSSYISLLSEHGRYIKVHSRMLNVESLLPEIEGSHLVYYEGNPQNPQNHPDPVLALAKELVGKLGDLWGPGGEPDRGTRILFAGVKPQDQRNPNLATACQIASECLVDDFIELFLKFEGVVLETTENRTGYTELRVIHKDCHYFIIGKMNEYKSEEGTIASVSVKFFDRDHVPIAGSTKISESLMKLMNSITLKDMVTEIEGMLKTQGMFAGHV